MKKNLFNEPTTEQFKNKVFQSVLPELEKNRKAHKRKRYLQWASSLSLCLVLVAGLHFYQKSVVPFPKNPDLAMVPSHELEMYENLDLIEQLDDLQALDESENFEDSI
jgi:hypothetical protein